MCVLHVLHIEKCSRQIYRNKLGFFVQLVYLRDYEHKESKLKCHMHLLYRRVV